VRDATLDATGKLVAEHGLAAVTMSKIAAETGIGRATLYKYFPDLEAILVAWHERQVSSHLEQLARVRAQAGPPGRRLEAVLAAYARLTWARPHGAGLAAVLHRCPWHRGYRQRVPAAGPDRRWPRWSRSAECQGQRWPYRGPCIDYGTRTPPLAAPT